MAVAVIMDFPGGTSDQYDAVMEDMALGGELPAGSLAHGAGATATGWRVIDIWDDPAAFGKFAETQIGPFAAKHGIGEPKVEMIELAEVLSGTGTPGFAQVFRLPITKEQFLDIHKQALPDSKPPEGGIIHGNGAGADGWIVVDFWTDQAARDAFVGGTIAPLAAAAGEGPPPNPPEDLVLHNHLI